jgi:hypothetical protein
LKTGAALRPELSSLAQSLQPRQQWKPMPAGLWLGAHDNGRKRSLIVRNGFELNFDGVYPSVQLFSPWRFSAAP